MSLSVMCFFNVQFSFYFELLILTHQSLAVNYKLQIYQRNTSVNKELEYYKPWKNHTSKRPCSDRLYPVFLHWHTLKTHTLSRLYSCQSSLGQKAPCDSRSLADWSRTQSCAWTGNRKVSWHFISNNLSVITQNAFFKIQYWFLPASSVCSHLTTSNILFQ